MKDKLNINGIVGHIARIREHANLLIEEELYVRGIAGVLPAHGSVLHFLFEQDRPVPIKAVVEAVGRVKSTVTSVVQTLERYGYVRKSPFEADGRVTQVELTDKGQALRKDFEAISRKLLNQLYGTMPKQDRRTLVSLLSQLEANMSPDKRR